MGFSAILRKGFMINWSWRVVRSLPSESSLVISLRVSDSNLRNVGPVACLYHSGFLLVFVTSSYTLECAYARLCVES